MTMRKRRSCFGALGIDDGQTEEPEESLKPKSSFRRPNHDDVVQLASPTVPMPNVHVESRETWLGLSPTRSTAILTI